MMTPAFLIQNQLGSDDPRAHYQIWHGSLPLWLARGRTRLNVKFGDGAANSPVISPLAQDWPDIILGYDIWQYWVAPLGADLTEEWKTVTDDRAGLPSDFGKHARFFAPRRGTFTAAFPVLRNPMMLLTFGVEANSEGEGWSTWAELVSAVTGNISWDPSLFSPSALYPQPTEAAIAMVMGFGGRLATTTPESASPDFASAPAAAGIRALVELWNAGRGRQLATAPRGAGAVPVYPMYMWGLFGRMQRPFGMLQPLPRGPVRPAVPCTYLCATVISQGTHLRQTADFASFLMNPVSQQALAGWQGGLALRTEQAKREVAKRFPHLREGPATTLASGVHDIIASDVYGGEKTSANQEMYNSVADRFASALTALQSASSGSTQTAAVLRQAVTG